MLPSVRRLEWLDLFRGLAVLGMVWTHAGHTFLETRLRQSDWFHALDYYHGLIAPAFFWISGYVRAHVTAGAPKPAWPALKRLLQVMLIGYLLHLPWYSLPQLNGDEWREALKVDVLQCLAVTGMLMLVIERCGRWRDAVAAVLLAGIVALQAPAAHWRTGLLAIDQYLNYEQGSLFPLFPWAAFGLAGFLTRGLWAGLPNRAAAALFAGGALLAFLPGLSALLTKAPAFFFQRLGYVMMAAVLASCAGSAVLAVTGWLRLAGRESLLLYVAHLVIIHSLPLPLRPLRELIGPTQPLWAVALITCGLFAACLLLGFGNERWKRSRRSRGAAAVRA